MNRRKFFQLSLIPFLTSTGVIGNGFCPQATKPSVDLTSAYEEAYRLWVSSQTTCPQLYISKKRLEKASLKEQAHLDFLAGEVFEVKGYRISKLEVAVLASLYLA